MSCKKCDISLTVVLVCTSATRYENSDSKPRNNIMKKCFFWPEKYNFSIKKGSL